MHGEARDPLGTCDAAASLYLNHPLASNNLALALFCSGEVERARQLTESSWHAEPNNLCALELTVRWRCWRFGLGSAVGFSAALRHTPARSSEDAIARVVGLLFLREWAMAGEAWRSAANEDFWHRSGADQQARFHYLGSIAALRGAEPEQARRRLQRALDVDLEHRPSAALLAKLSGSRAETSDEIDIGGPWFAQAWLDRMRGLCDLAPALQQSWFDALSDTCDAHADYLGMAAELGGPTICGLAIAILKRRACKGDAAAVAKLQDLLSRPYGSDAALTSIQRWLSERDQHDSRRPARIWLEDRLHDGGFRSFEVTRESSPSLLPATGAALHDEIHAALGRGKLCKAHELALRLQRLYPEHPVALANLAAIKESLHHPLRKVAEFYRQAHAIAPDYVCARCGLARTFIHMGALTEAMALLVGILDGDKYHYTEYRSILSTQKALALAMHETAAAAALDDSLLWLEQEFGR